LTKLLAAVAQGKPAKAPSREQQTNSDNSERADHNTADYEAKSRECHREMKFIRGASYAFLLPIHNVWSREYEDSRVFPNAPARPARAGLIGMQIRAAGRLPVVASELALGSWAGRLLRRRGTRIGFAFGDQLRLGLQPILHRAALLAAFALVNGLRSCGDFIVGGYLCLRVFGHKTSSLSVACAT